MQMQFLRQKSYHSWRVDEITRFDAHRRGNPLWLPDTLTGKQNR